MRFYPINEWRGCRSDFSVLNVTVSRHDVTVVVMGLGVGVWW